MKRNNNVSLDTNQPFSSVSSSKKPLGAKKFLKLKAKDFFHKVSGLSKKRKRTLNYFLYWAPRLPSLFMMQATIGKFLGITREWVCKCIKYLAALGLMVSKRRHYKTNIYAVSPLFFKQEVIHELYVILSSLREFKKKFTQVKDEDNINKHTLPIVRDKEHEPPPKREQPDVMSWSLDDILSLTTKNNRKVAPSVDRSAVRTQSGFRKIGSLL